MADADEEPSGDEPGGVELGRQQRGEREEDNTSEGEQVAEVLVSEVDGDDDEKADRRGVATIEDGPHGRSAQARSDEAPEKGDEHEGGKEDGHGGNEGAGSAVEQVADEGGGGEQRSGSDLANGDGVPALIGAEHTETVDELGLDERDDDVVGCTG